MSSDLDNLTRLFEDAGWARTRSGACDAAFGRKDSVVGIVLAESAAGAVARAGDAQAEIREYRNDPENRHKDFYLIYVVHRLGDEALDTLERTIDDPYVCRKLLVERGDRPLAAAISELGLFLPFGPATGGETSAPVTSQILDEQTWDRLRRRGVPAIADLLIEEEGQTEHS